MEASYRSDRIKMTSLDLMLNFISFHWISLLQRIKDSMLYQNQHLIVRLGELGATFVRLDWAVMLFDAPYFHYFLVTIYNPWIRGIFFEFVRVWRIFRWPSAFSSRLRHFVGRQSRNGRPTSAASDDYVSISSPRSLRECISLPFRVGLAAARREPQDGSYRSRLWLTG